MGHIYTAGSRKLKVTKFAARHGLRVLTRIARVVGPAMAEAAGGRKGEPEAAVTKSLRAAIEQVTPEEVDWLVDEFAAQTTVDLNGKGMEVRLSSGDTFDQIFADDYAAILGWFRFCLELNFAGFLASIGVRLPAAPTSTPSKSESPTA